MQLVVAFMIIQFRLQSSILQYRAGLRYAGKYYETYEHVKFGVCPHTVVILAGSIKSGRNPKTYGKLCWVQDLWLILLYNL